MGRRQILLVVLLLVVWHGVAQAKAHTNYHYQALCNRWKAASVAVTYEEGLKEIAGRVCTKMKSNNAGCFMSQFACTSAITEKLRSRILELCPYDDNCTLPRLYRSEDECPGDGNYDVIRCTYYCKKGPDDLAMTLVEEAEKYYRLETDDSNMHGIMADLQRTCSCGNGIVDEKYGEECDLGEGNGKDMGLSGFSTCRDDCKNKVIRMKRWPGVTPLLDLPPLDLQGNSRGLIPNNTPWQPIFPVDPCGNGVIDSGEFCDDGSENGKPGKCSSDCMAPL